MADHSNIEWTDSTWNPVTGCTKVSPGCDNCYAIRDGARLQHLPAYEGTIRDGDWTGKINHPDVPLEFIAQVFGVMAAASHHQFQILTKRPQRMQSLLREAPWRTARDRPPFARLVAGNWVEFDPTADGALLWPLPNVWLGTSIESDRYTFRADPLRATPAAVRFLSLEPLLGPLPSLDLDGIDWVIVGGESGPYARPMHPSWVADIRDRCVDASVAFLFKQWGEWSPGSLYAHEPQDRPVRVMLEDGRLYSYDEWQDVGHSVKSADVAGATFIARRGRKATGRELDGRTWDEFPQVVVS